MSAYRFLRYRMCSSDSTASANTLKMASAGAGGRRVCAAGRHPAGDLHSVGVPVLPRCAAAGGAGRRGPGRPRVAGAIANLRANRQLVMAAWPDGPLSTLPPEGVGARCWHLGRASGVLTPSAEMSHHLHWLALDFGPSSCRCKASPNELLTPQRLPGCRSSSSWAWARWRTASSGTHGCGG